MAERKFCIGIIGCGNIANKQHLPNEIANPRARLVAVADVDADRARATAERWGVVAHFQNYRDLIAHPAVEAVSVTTSPAAHAEAVIAAAEADKHILCEKPMATTLEVVA